MNTQEADLKVSNTSCCWLAYQLDGLNKKLLMTKYVVCCVPRPLEDPAEAVVVGRADGASPIPTCLAKAGSVSEAGLDSHNAGAADKR